MVSVKERLEVRKYNLELGRRKLGRRRNVALIWGLSWPGPVGGACCVVLVQMLFSVSASNE